MRLTNDGTPRRNITRTSGALVTIPEKFTMIPPSPTPTSKSESSSGGGIGAGAIIGILVAALIALVGLMMLARKRNSAQNAASAVALTRIRLHSQEIRPTHEIKASMDLHFRRDNPNLLCAATTTCIRRVLSTTTASVSSCLFTAHSCNHSHTSRLSSSLCFSTHPRPTVAQVMDPNDPILQQQSQPQQQLPLQSKQSWQPQLFVPPNQAPVPQGSPSTSSPGTLNRPLPPIPPRP